MSRDPNKLKVFAMADELVMSIYSSTRVFPIEERYGLQSQIRRAALSVPTNIVEGCARPTLREYLRYMGIATSSASETRYLIGVAHRLGYFDARDLLLRYTALIRALQSLLTTLGRGLRPEA